METSQILDSGRVERISRESVEERLGREIGQRYLDYRQMWAGAGPANIPAFPIHIDFELIDECNMRCGFCPRNQTTHPDLPYEINTKAKISDELMRKVIAESGERGLQSVNFAFGEPMLDERLFDWVRDFHRAGIVDTRVITNGLLLGKNIDKIFDSGLVNLFVSLDAADKAMHTQQRGYGYDKIVANLKALLAEKERRKSIFPIVRVSFVDTGRSHHQLEEFRKLWADVVDHIDIQMYQNLGKFAPSGSKKLWACNDPFRRVSVTADGNIIPCCTFHGKLLPVGNIANDTILEAWTSERMAMVRHRLLNDEEPICVACQETV
jgi:radical SAM protein with 4Fe4S-binding SPASM domain